MMLNTKHYLIGLLLSTGVNLDASGGTLIKCWYDTRGVRECGSVVPQEFARNRIEVINEQGVVVQVIEASRTPEEIEREKERDRVRKEREAKLAAQKRRDEILLNTYTTEKDLFQARDKNLAGANSQIDIVKNNLSLHQSNLDQLNRAAADHERNGTTPPVKLVEDIAKARQDIEELNSSLKQRQDEKETLIKRYEEDLKRFRELKRKILFN